MGIQLAPAHEKVMSLGARVLKAAGDGDSADSYQVYADPPGIHSACARQRPANPAASGTVPLVGSTAARANLASMSRPGALGEKCTHPSLASSGWPRSPAHPIVIETANPEYLLAFLTAADIHAAGRLA